VEALPAAKAATGAAVGSLHAASAAARITRGMRPSEFDIKTS
jgi:hypothetical protein